MAPSRPGERAVLHAVICGVKDGSEQHVVGSPPGSLQSEGEMGLMMWRDQGWKIQGPSVRRDGDNK